MSGSLLPVLPASCADTDYFPCSDGFVGNIILMVMYGVILAYGSKLIADGSELLMEILDPGLIGGFILPVLGALPDATIIVVSALGASPDLVQEQLKVGVGALAGSTIMLLTLPWFGATLLGRCDFVNGHAQDKTLTRRFDLFHTGVEVEDHDITKQAWIMMGTAVSYVVIQGVAFGYLGQSAESQASHERPVALAAFILAAVLFVVYCVYMVCNTRLQERRMREAKRAQVLKQAVERFVEMAARRAEDRVDRETSPLVGVNVDQPAAQPPDVRRLGLKWKEKASSRKQLPPVPPVAEPVKTEAEDADEEEEEATSGLPKGKVALKSLTLMLVGTAMVFVFSDPMVDSITKFAGLASLNPFYVAFVIVPLTSNASELIASLQFAAKKRKKNIALSFAAVYGAATMNNTLCLGIFLGLIFFQDLRWEFSAEVVAILFVTAVVGVIASTRRLIPLYFGFIVLLLYPLSIGIVAVLESPAINWQ